MKKLTLFVILLLWASAAQAQSLKIPTMVFAAAATSDWASTYVVDRGPYVTRTSVTTFHEDNPLINGLQSRPATMVAVGAAIDVVGVTLWNHYVGRNHPKLAAVGLYVAAAGRIAMAANNLSQRP